MVLHDTHSRESNTQEKKYEEHYLVSILEKRNCPWPQYLRTGTPNKNSHENSNVCACTLLCFRLVQKSSDT